MKSRWTAWGAAALLAAALAGPVAGDAVAGDEENDMLIRVRPISPREGADWDSGLGAEAQWRFRDNEQVGFALALGAATWTAVSEYVAEQGAFEEYTSRIEGEAALLTFGGSVWARSPLAERVALTFEGGIRYAVVDSSIDVFVHQELGGASFTELDVIDIENTWLATLGVNLEVALTSHVTFQAGLGYDLDLTHPRETVLDGPLGNTDFSGFAFNAGFAVAFQ